MCTRLITGLFGLVLLLAPVNAQQAWVVDDQPGPGVDFTNLAGAVTAAADGDTLLVQSGNYAGFTVNGKSLEILAAPSAAVTVVGQVSIRNISTSMFVSMRGLTVVGSATPALLRVRDSQGTVWIEDSFVLSGSIFAAGHACLVESSTSVVLVNCTLTGGHTTFAGQPAGDGLRALNSDIVLQGCAMRGADGVCSSNACNEPGAGLSVDSSTVDLQSTTLRGGGSGPGFCCQGGTGDCVVVGKGGPALQSLSADSILRGTEATLVPGSALGPCGISGDTWTGTAVLNLMPATTLSLDVAATVVTDEPLTASVQGAPLAPVFLVLTHHPSPLWLPGAFGTWMNNASLVIDSWGPTDASGFGQRTYVGPWLPPGTEALGVTLQPVQLLPGGGLLLGGASRVVALQSEI